MGNYPEKDDLPARVRYARVVFSLKEGGVASAEALAEQLGVSAATISRWESGDRTPTRQNQERLAEVCRVPLDWVLLGGVDRLPVELRPEGLAGKRPRPPHSKRPAGKAKAGRAKRDKKSS